MIPALISLAGAPWDVLPPGIHPATLSEVETMFAYNRRRRELFEGVLRAAVSLRAAGCALLYPDGSFVTAKPLPGDYDACWAPQGVHPARLDPVFRDFSNLRQAQKDKFEGEFFPSSMLNRPGETFLDLFQKEKFTHLPKGILVIDIASDPRLAASTP